MSNENSERDTHFQGYAKLLMPELDSLFVLLYQAYATGNTAKRDEYSQRIETLLARRAHNFALHVLLYSAGEPWIDSCPPEEWVERIPDMTEWPKSS